MADKYVEKQLQFYGNATNQQAKDDALYRIGTYLELDGMECDGNAKLTEHGREVILDAAKEVQNELV